jgi:collagenase-like PrtC family protease
MSPSPTTASLPTLCVPSNLQDDLPDLLDFSRISEMYGKLREDPLGGGRSSLILPSVSKRQASRHIRKIRDKGVSFNYLLNTSCLDNLEFTRAGRKRIEKALSFAVKAGADSCTVTIPHLLEIVKKLEPSMTVNISTMAGVDSAEMAAYFEDLGADRITLSVTDVNRNFPVLKAIRKRVKCELQIIANLECLRGCPFTRYHANINSHASQKGHPSGGLVLDYCYLNCSILRLTEPGNFFMAGWIRPEDQHHYGAIGMDAVKLVNRAMTSAQIAHIVDAYTQARYDGNLLDLFSHPSSNLAYTKGSSLKAARYMFKPSKLNVLKLARYKDMFTWEMPYIDNRKLDGFIDYFLEGSCHPEVCQDKCNYCFQWAQREFKMSDEARRKALGTLHRFKGELIDGSLFKYP